MKNLRKILCAILILPVLFMFSACGKSGGGNDKGNDNKPEQEHVLTNQEIMKLAFDTFDEKSQTIVQGKNSFASKNESGEYNYSSYNEYVYATLCVLEEISTLNNILENTIYCGVSAELEGKTEYANNVAKYWISSLENYGLVNIVVKMQLSIEGKNIKEYPESFDNYQFNITYSRETKYLSFDIFVEKSRNFYAGEDLNSYSNCYTISYDSNQLVTSSFKRNANIDISDLAQVNPTTISDYKMIRMNLLLNEVIYEQDGFNGETNVQSDIFEKLSKLNTLSEELSGPNAIFVNELITNKIILIVNAEKISDFEIEE